VPKQTGQFDWFERGELLRTLALDDEQFANTCHLAGHEGCPPLPVGEHQDLTFKSTSRGAMPAMTGLRH